MLSISKEIASSFFYEVLDMPLEVMAPKGKPSTDKILSGLAIGFFSVLSLGAYAIYAYQFFRDRKIISLQSQLEEAIKGDNNNLVKQIITKYPLLTTKPDLLEKNKRETILTKNLIYPVHAGNFALVKLLCENGAKLNFSVHGYTPLQEALNKEYTEIATYLIENGASISWDFLHHCASWNKINFDMMCLLIEHCDEVKSDNHCHSLIAYLWNRGRGDQQKYKQMVALLIAKGDRPIENDLVENNVPEEIRQFIANELAKYSS